MQRLREQYGEYLTAHKKAGIKLPPLAFHDVDAWYLELKRINDIKDVVAPLPDHSNRVLPHG